MLERYTMNIIVLAGGLSAERDVSLKTGSMVANALKENGHTVILLDAFMGYGEAETDVTSAFSHPEDFCLPDRNILEVAPDLNQVKASRKDQSDCFFGPNVLALCREADIVFMALHGENGENGKVQATFDLLGIRYTGSDYLSSAVAMNKKMAKEILVANGVQMPKGTSTKKGCPVNDILAKVTFPCVVKPCSGGSSVGVSIVNDEKDFEAALEEAFLWEDCLLIEEYIKGREFSVGVVDGEAYPVIEIAPLQGFYDYKNKYKAGSAVETCPAEIPAEITAKMQSQAVLVTEVLGLDTYSRSDFLLSEDNGIYCLEVNTLPGMTATSLLPQEANAIGISFPMLCEKIIEISLRRYEK